MYIFCMAHFFWRELVVKINNYVLFLFRRSPYTHTSKMGQIKRDFFVSALKCQDIVLGSSIRTWYAFSSTRAMPRVIRRFTPTIIAHSMNKTFEAYKCQVAR